MQNLKPELKPVAEPATPTRTENFVNKAALVLLFIAAGLILSFILVSSKTSEKVADTQAYTRVTACVISKNATTRIQADIEECYVQVERQTGLSLQRFDHQPN